MTASEPAPAEVVDAVGLLCPLPVLRAEQASHRHAPGAVIEVLADDPAIVDDLPAWCEGRGHELLALAEDADAAARPRWRARVRLGAGAGRRPA